MSKKRIDIMLDIETTALSANEGQILELTMGFFNIEDDCRLKRSITITIKPENVVRFNASTLEFWTKRSDVFIELLKDCYENGKSKEEAKEEFSQIIKDVTATYKTVKLWCKSTPFDIPFIKDFLNIDYQELGLNFRNIFDIRTIEDNASRFTGKTKDQLYDSFKKDVGPRTIKHRSANDVLNQINYLRYLNNILKKGSYELKSEKHNQ